MFSLSSGRVGTPPELSSSENEEEKSKPNEPFLLFIYSMIEFLVFCLLKRKNSPRLLFL